MSCSQVIIKEKLYDEDHLKRKTDLPFLVRQDNNDFLRPEDIIKGYKRKMPQRDTHVFSKGTKIPSIKEQGDQYIPKALAEEWGDYVVWDSNWKTV